MEFVGKVIGVVYTQKSSWFNIIKVRSIGSVDNEPINEDISVKCTIPNFNIVNGLVIRFSGEFKDHPTFGKQFIADSATVINDKTKVGSVAYIISVVPNVGSVTATKLYDFFGDSLVDILENNPERLNEVNFLTDDQKTSIISEFSHANTFRTNSISLANIGFNKSQIKSILTNFPMSRIDEIKSNPYIVSDVPGVGFLACDYAASILDINPDDPIRIKHLVLFALYNFLNSEGHMFTNSSELKNYMNSSTFSRKGIRSFSYGDYISDTHFYNTISTLLNEDYICYHNNDIYPKKFYIQESDAAYNLAKCYRSLFKKRLDISNIIEDFENGKNIKLSPLQKKAIELFNDESVIAISGYPGTGKTLLIGAFVQLFEKNNFTYKLLSPTGIAAKLLSSVTNRPASTIHRALGYNKDGSFTFNRFNKLYADAIIIDEMSMVDSSTFHLLISSLDSKCRIILVGDENQLPSVGNGSVFKQILSSNIPNVKLTDIYRQDKGNDVIKVARDILDSNPVDLEFNPNSNFLFINTDKDSIMDELKNLSSTLFQKQKNFQIIAPVYDGDVGVKSINNNLRPILNPLYNDNTRKYKGNGEDIYEGDRVMVIKNSYDHNIYNGDVGKVISIDTKSDCISVKVFNWFDEKNNQFINKIIDFKLEEARLMLRLAYAVTVHRSQGQSYDFVILPMTNDYSHMLYKNLVYTALTRVRKKVFIIGDPNAFHFSIMNDRDTNRKSNLAFFVNDFINKELANVILDA